MGRDFEAWAVNYIKTGESIWIHRKEMKAGDLSERITGQAEVRSHLAEIGAGVSSTTYSGWENGTKHPTLHHLLALCRVFGCCLDDLVQINDPARQKERQVPPVSRNYEKTKYGWAINKEKTGESIKRHRLELGLSQDEMVDNICAVKGRSEASAEEEAAGLSKEAYITWEKGIKCPTVRNLLALCQIFECSLDDLVITDDRAREMERKKQKASREKSRASVPGQADGFIL